MVPWHTVDVITNTFSYSELGWDTGKKKGMLSNWCDCLRHLKDIQQLQGLRKWVDFAID